jgi:hypothetical protein
MHCLLSVIDDQGTPGDDSEAGAVDTFNKQVQADGYWVIEADDLDVALQLSAGASKACNRKIEVRPFDGIA